MTAPRIEDLNDGWNARLVRGAPGSVAGNWKTGQRETLHQARRYSAFVRFMKRALPLAALGLGIAVFAYVIQPRDSAQIAITFERVDAIDNDVTMVNPRLTGTDENGRPFVVAASSAVPLDSSNSKVRLQNVTAEMVLRDGTLLELTAGEGIVDNVNRELEIYGGIRLASANGYFAQTASARAELGTGIVRSTAPITAENAFGRLTAQQFTFERESEMLYFAGDVRMHLYEVAQ